MKEFASVKDRILDRALYTIGKKGSMDVTVRDIAKEANVNVAALNYYFGPKANMIKEMEELFISNYNDTYEALYDDNLTSEEKISKMLNEILLYTLRYPGITVVVNEKVIDEKSEIGKCIKKNLYKNSLIIRKLIKEISECSDEQAMFYEMILLSSVVFPALSNNFKQEGNQINFEDNIDRQKYINHLIMIIKGDKL